ncbi:MAG: TIGR03663 family protein [Chloroflexota bacterium]|nr:TIGR03663 family protein [Chloroflexota bacterium]
MSAIAVGFHLTLERTLWITLLAIAALTRLWDLAYRTQHHDESIHTTFSWDLAVGNSYVHDPLSHGPFLFHANALVYFLLGSSDVTSRLLPALVGIAVVAAPLLLRHRDFLGRWGALAAGTLLLFSPSLLYYTRFIRHDPYTILGTALLVAAIFRYLHSPQRKWIILAFISVAVLLANHEIIFAVFLVFVLVLWGALVFSRMRFLIPVHLIAVALLMVLLAMSSLLGWSAFPEIPWQTGGPDAAQDYYGRLLTHPLVIGVLLVGVAFLGGCVWAIQRAARARISDGSVIEPLLGSADQGSVARGVRDAWNDPVSVGIGALLALWIFFGLFTTLFTQLDGIATGTYATDGTLLYWLGQHGEQRGAQPWFYYITEGLQYEWLAIFLTLIALVLTGITVVKRLIHRDWSYDPTILFRVFLACWLVFIFAVLSWAGEKMPWLIMHILLPAALLSGTAIQDLVASASRWRDRRAGVSDQPNAFTIPAVLAAILVVLAGAFFLIAANLTQGGYDPVSGASRSVIADHLDDWWRLLLPLFGAIISIVGVVLLRGMRPAIYGALTGVLAIMLLFQVHAGFRLALEEGDVSIDTLIYNTVGPDAKQVVEDVALMSEIYLGDQSITVSNDNCTNWPLEWYFRDFENYRFISSVADTTQDLPDVMIGVPRDWDSSQCTMPLEIPGYTSHPYVFRWHEPEGEVYRNFALAPEIAIGRSAWVSEDQATGPLAVLESVWSSITSTGDPDQQQQLWRLLMYREQPGVLTEYAFKVYVRDDLMPYYNDARYGP